MFIKKMKIWKFFSSIKLAIWLLAFIALTSIVGTIIPQNKQPAEYIARYGHDIYNVLGSLGLFDVYGAWWFLSLLALLALNLLGCIVNRFSLRVRFLGTLLCHISILVIFAGSLIGIFFGEKGYVQIAEGHSINSFMSGKNQVKLDFSLRLDDFIYEEYIDNKREKLQVFSKEKKDLLLEISTEKGKEVLISDSGYTVKVLRYVPDFSMDTKTKEVVSRSQEPKNPAIEVELKDKEGQKKTVWVFARFPDIHQNTGINFKLRYLWCCRRPKSFISKVTIIQDGKEIKKQAIEVNFPLRFSGYAFFQSSYDKQNLRWSGLQIVKDPGVPIVYLGFTLLILGLIIIFYVNPVMKKRG